jgi:hypothetical protein
MVSAMLRTDGLLSGSSCELDFLVGGGTGGGGL